MIKLLVADDEINILNLYKIRLERQGYFVKTALDGEEALNQIVNNSFDLLILDVMMPKMDGLEVMQEIKKRNISIPVIMVTAKGDLNDKMKGFNEGVDDYLVKPFEFDELIFRIKALLRRAKIFTENKITIGNVVLDSSTLTIKNTITQTNISLPKKEFDILYKLLSYPERTFTKEQLFNEFWSYESDADLDSLKVYISKIRSQIKVFPEIDIETIRGIGYRGIRNEKK